MIKLTDKLAVTADSNQYVLGTPYEGKDKDGNLVTLMRNTTYYMTLAGVIKAAISKALKHGVSDGEITTLRQFAIEQQKLESEFLDLIDPLNI